MLGSTAQLEHMNTRYHVKFIITLKSSVSRRLTPYTDRRELPRFSVHASSWTGVRQLQVFSFMGNRRVLTTSSSADSEISDYFGQQCIAEDTNALFYWQQQHLNVLTLSKLAKQNPTLPASSAPVERLFSIAGKIFRSDRCSLKDHTFETLMFIGMNSK